MSSFGSAANLIRRVGLIVLCGLSILTVACGATPTPDLLSEVQELLDFVQQTDVGSYFYTGFVYRQDVTPVQAWEIQGRALTKLQPEVADQKHAAAEVGCRADGSVGRGRVSEIVITSPTRAQATFRWASDYEEEYYDGVLQLEKADGAWRVLSEEILQIDCPPYISIPTPN